MTNCIICNRDVEDDKIKLGDNFYHDTCLQIEAEEFYENV
jgi:hypothetical protein